MAATWDDVGVIARDLPVAEAGVRDGHPTWKVGKNVSVWVRPLRARDHEELGDAARTGDIIGASTLDVGEKLALIALDHVDPERLREFLAADRS